MRHAGKHGRKYLDRIRLTYLAEQRIEVAVLSTAEKKTKRCMIDSIANERKVCLKVRRFLNTSSSLKHNNRYVFIER